MNCPSFGGGRTRPFSQKRTRNSRPQTRRGLGYTPFLRPRRTNVTVSPYCSLSFALSVTCGSKDPHEAYYMNNTTACALLSRCRSIVPAGQIKTVISYCISDLFTLASGARQAASRGRIVRQQSAQAAKTHGLSGILSSYVRVDETHKKSNNNRNYFCSAVNFPPTLLPLRRGVAWLLARQTANVPMSNRI